MPSKELSMKLAPGRLERFRFSNLTIRVREACFNQLISISTGGIHPNISLWWMVSDMTRYDHDIYDTNMFQYDPQISVFCFHGTFWLAIEEERSKATAKLTRPSPGPTMSLHGLTTPTKRPNTEIWAGDHRLIQRTVTIRNTDIGRLRGPSETSGVSVTNAKVG